MRALAIACFALALVLGVGALVYVQRPSVMPLATAVGAFALPALLTWWGTLLWRRASASSPRSFVLPANVPTSVAVAAVLFALAIPIAYSLMSERNAPESISAAERGTPSAQLATGATLAVAASCPENARLLSVRQIRERYPSQYSDYSDSELLLALQQLCYPTEDVSTLGQRLEAFAAAQRAKQ